MICGARPRIIVKECSTDGAARAEGKTICIMPSRDRGRRIVNALEPGTVMPIHRHRNSSETVVIVRGSLIERFYDEEGNITEEVLMRPGGDTPVANVEKGRWHNLECLESNTVIFEGKDGKY